MPDCTSVLGWAAVPPAVMPVSLNACQGEFETGVDLLGRAGRVGDCELDVALNRWLGTCLSAPHARTIAGIDLRDAAGLMTG